MLLNSQQRLGLFISFSKVLCKYTSLLTNLMVRFCLVLTYQEQKYLNMLTDEAAGDPHFPFCNV